MVSYSCRLIVFICNREWICISCRSSVSIFSCFRWWWWWCRCFLSKSLVGQATSLAFRCWRVNAQNLQVNFATQTWTCSQNENRKWINSIHFVCGKFVVCHSQPFETFLHVSSHPLKVWFHFPDVGSNRVDGVHETVECLSGLPDVCCLRGQFSSHLLLFLLHLLRVLLHHLHVLLHHLHVPLHSLDALFKLMNSFGVWVFDLALEAKPATFAIFCVPSPSAANNGVKRNAKSSWETGTDLEQEVYNVNLRVMSKVERRLGWKQFNESEVIRSETFIHSCHHSDILAFLDEISFILTCRHNFSPFSPWKMILQIRIGKYFLVVTFSFRDKGHRWMSLETFNCLLFQTFSNCVFFRKTILACTMWKLVDIIFSQLIAKRRGELSYGLGSNLLIDCF